MRGGEGHVRHGTTLPEAIWIIIVADVVMSLDNVIGVAGAAEGDMRLVVFGIGLSIPIVVWGSGILASLMNRYPWIILIAGGILGEVAGKMLAARPLHRDPVRRDAPTCVEWTLRLGLAGAIVLIGWLTARRRAPRRGGEATRRRSMDIEPVKSTRIYEEIVRQVKQLIAEGKLKSGDQLPPERDLAEKFMVSRTSVREALRALQSRGLIEIRAGEGTFVRDISVETLIEPLALVILPHREAVGELFEARRLLEPAIAALAARRATPEDIAEMARILEEQAKEVAQGRTGLTQDAAFHGAMAASAHNRAISRIDGALMDLLTQSREESLHTPGRPTRSHEDHQRILDAIRRRDEVGAHRAVLDHLTAVERLVMGTRGARHRRDRDRRRERRGRGA